MSTALHRILPRIMPPRIAGDTANQMFSPFLGVIAAGIGITNQQLGLLVSLRSAFGLAGPFLGELADRHGHLRLARVGIVMMAASLLMLAASNSLVTAALAMAPMGLALGLINPALQAYVSANASHRNRARGMGIFEYSWALAGIIGLPLLGWLISAFGWRVALTTLAVLILLAMLGMRSLSPAPVQAAAQSHAAPGLRASLTLWSGICAVGLTFYASLNAMIIHGVWLAEAFAFTPGTLGLLAIALGLADLSGSGFVSLAADRIGPRRVVLAAGLLSVGAYLLPHLGTGLALAIGALFLMRMLMQASFVALLTILSEQLPARRARVLAFAAASGQVGMAVAGASGPWLYGRLGMPGVGTVSAAAALAAFVLVLIFMKEKREVA